MNFESARELLAGLVATASVNPENDPGTDRVGELAVAKLLAEWMSSWGARVELEEVLPGRPNLIARFAPMDGRPRILFGPHLDTVGVGGMTVDPFSAEIREGNLYGRGASDTKGPMAAMLWAMYCNREKLAEMPVAIDFVGFMGEEGHQWGSRHFAARHGKDYRFAVVGEPTGLDIVCWTKGSSWLLLSAGGKAAHSSMPELGDNAIMKLMRALQGLESEVGPILEASAHPVLGPSTMNVGKISGGSRPNIVPDSAEAVLDIRTTPGLYRLGSPVEIVGKWLAQNAPGVECRELKESRPMATDSGLPEVHAMLAAGSGRKLVGAPWFSDAAHLSAAGVPAVCCGPGSILQAHTVDEFISLDDLDQGVEFFKRLIHQLG